MGEPAEAERPRVDDLHPGEIAAAPWLGLNADQHQGFPQPRDDEFGYLDVTYDTDDYCRACGSVSVRRRHSR